VVDASRRRIYPPRAGQRHVLSQGPLQFAERTQSSTLAKMSVARLARLCDGFGKLKSSLHRDNLRPGACDDVTWATKLASGPSSNSEL
jgi:hypothetical protein